MKILVSAICILVSTLALTNANDFANIEGQIAHHADSMAEACVSIKAQSGAWGSGVIVSRSGMIFSAAHVYKRSGEQVTVFLSQGRQVGAQVIRFDREHNSERRSPLRVGFAPHPTLGPQAA